MKQIKCEMCGGVDLVKQDKYFVCQTCGVKYSLDEVKKLMVDVSGSKISIDETDKIKNYSKLMLNANFNKDFKNVLKYANKILEINYEDTIAKVFQDFANRNKQIYGINFTNAIFGISGNNEINEEYYSENKEFIIFCIDSLFEKFYSVILRTFTVGFESGIRIAGLEELHNWKAIFDKLIDKFKDIDLILKYYNIFFKYVSICIDEQFGTLNNEEYAKSIRLKLKPEQYKEVIGQYSYIDDRLNRLGIEHKKIDSSVYECYMNDLEKAIEYYNSVKNNSKKQGCYIATCIYGSYDSPEVWVLRRFRDNYLNNYVLGRLFISLYYLISTRVIEIFGKYNVFKNINRIWLDKLVSYLKSIGYSSKPYKDILDE